MDKLFELCTICEGIKYIAVNCDRCGGKGIYTPRTKTHPCEKCNKLGKIKVTCHGCFGVGHVLTKEGKILERIFDANKRGYY